MLHFNIILNYKIVNYIIKFKEYKNMKIKNHINIRNQY